MSLNYTTLKAEISAIHAGAALLERSIQQQTNLPLEPEKPSFKVSDYSETKLVGITEEMSNYGYIFSEFNALTKPKHLKHIISIQLTKPESRYYYVVISCFSTPDQVAAELESLLLPF